VRSSIGRTVKNSLPHDAMKRDMAAILYNNILFIITLKLNIQTKSEISRPWVAIGCVVTQRRHQLWIRSEEHTSELQSRENLVCRLLLEKKKKTRKKI